MAEAGGGHMSSVARTFHAKLLLTRMGFPLGAVQGCSSLGSAGRSSRSAARAPTLGPAAWGRAAGVGAQSRHLGEVARAP